MHTGPAAKVEQHVSIYMYIHPKNNAMIYRGRTLMTEHLIQQRR